MLMMNSGVKSNRIVTIGIIALLFALLILPAGCSADHRTPAPTPAAEQQGSAKAAPSKTEQRATEQAIAELPATEPPAAEPSATESPAAAPAPTESDPLPEDRLVINRLPENKSDVYSVPLAAEIRDEKDPRMAYVTEMPQQELSEYYGLSIDTDALSLALESVLGDRVSSDLYSSFLPFPGVFRDGEAVYDANKIDLRTRHISALVTLSRSQNTVWPGGDVLPEEEPEESLEKSCLGGTECIIRVYGEQTVSEKRTGYHADARIGDAKVSAVICGVSEEQLAAVLKTVFSLLQGKAPDQP